MSSADTLPAGVEEAPSNSAVTQVYEPGSVFKLVTFSAALQQGLVDPNTPVKVPAALPMGTYTFHDAETHGIEMLTATQILAQSSNIGTIEIAQMLGETGLLDQIANLGFGRPTGLDFPGESEGLVPGASAWTGTSIGSTPIGQDDAVTAQQILDAYNAVANGGVFVAPRLVRGTVRPLGTVAAAASSPTHRVIAPATNAQLVSMLESVVTSGTGTERGHRRVHRGRQDGDGPDPRPRPSGLRARRLRRHVRRLRSGPGPGPLGHRGPRPPDAHLRWGRGRPGVLDHHGLRPPSLRDPDHLRPDHLGLQRGHRRPGVGHRPGRSDHGRTVGGRPPGPALPAPAMRPPAEVVPVLMETLVRDLPVVGRRGDLAAAEVTSIEFDSRQVRPGALFCCLPGSRTDGHDHAPAAVAAGATALLVERPLDLDVAQVWVGPG